MKKVSFVFCQRPQVHIRIVNEQFDALDVVLEDSVVKGCVPFVTLKVYVVGVSHLLQDVLYVVVDSFEAGQHEGSHLPFVVVFEVTAALEQYAEIVRTVGQGCVVDGSPA